MDRAMTPLHLTASMQVLRAHQRRRLVTVEEARRAVLEIADRVAAGMGGPETQRLVTKLEQATGVTLSELARHAQQWSEF
jgi:hypothetical protein